MIGDLDDCRHCRQRPRRLAIDDRADGRWYRLMCGCSLWWQLVVADQEPGREEPVASRRDLLRTQGAVIRLDERIGILECQHAIRGEPKRCGCGCGAILPNEPSRPVSEFVG